MSNWISFVKEFAAKNGQSYAQSLKSEDCKVEYHKAKPKKELVIKEPKIVKEPLVAKEPKPKKEKRIEVDVEYKSKNSKIPRVYRSKLGIPADVLEAVKKEMDGAMLEKVPQIVAKTPVKPKKTLSMRKPPKVVDDVMEDFIEFDGFQGKEYSE